MLVIWIAGMWEGMSLRSHNFLLSCNLFRGMLIKFVITKTGIDHKRAQTTTNHKQTTTNHQQKDHRPPINNQKPPANDYKPAANDHKLPTNNHKRPHLHIKPKNWRFGVFSCIRQLQRSPRFWKIYAASDGKLPLTLTVPVRSKQNRICVLW